MAQMNYSALWQAYKDEAYKAQARGEMTIAEAILRRALKEAEDALELDEGLVTDTHKLAAWHCINRNYESAERLYRSVLEVREKLLGTSHKDVQDSLEKLAVVLKEGKKQHEAKAISYRALSLRAGLASA